jgi:hypothetical protein
MKSIYSSAFILSITTASLALVSGCVVEPNGGLAFQPFVVAVAPPVVYAPVPEPAVLVPDTYVWDGYENVGYVGGQYYYLGAGDVWVVADPYRLDRFHHWEGGHPGWRDHGISNDRYRRDSRGHVQPRHDRDKH